MPPVRGALGLVSNASAVGLDDTMFRARVADWPWRAPVLRAMAARRAPVVLPLSAGLWAAARSVFAICASTVGLPMFAATILPIVTVSPLAMASARPGTG